MTRKSITLSVVLGIMLLCGTNVYAGEIENYFEITFSGDRCYAIDPDDDICLVRTTSGTIYNGCYSDIDVICPIGQLGYLIGEQITQVEAATFWFVDDTDYPYNFDCDLITRDSNGLSHSGITMDPGNYSDTSVHSYTNNTDLGWYDSWGPLYLVCEMPRWQGIGHTTSKIYAYSVYMNNGV